MTVRLILTLALMASVMASKTQFTVRSALSLVMFSFSIIASERSEFVMVITLCAVL